MKPLIQELDRAIERGWANGGHLAAIRELAVELEAKQEERNREAWAEMTADMRAHEEGRHD